MKIQWIALLILMLFAASSCSRKTTAEEHANEPLINQGPDRFIISLSKDIEKHDWQSFLAKCDSMQKTVQFYHSKKTQPQYIAEQLGIHEKDNSISDYRKEVSWDDLNKIKSIKISEWQEFVNSIEAFGILTLNDGRELKVKLVIVIINNKYYLTGAIG